ncbi:MAG: hypothetical protein ACRCVN_02120 [Spirochaetia bacterium]
MNEKSMQVTVAHTLRLPGDLHMAIQELADENLRSFSAQVQFILQNDPVVKERLTKLLLSKQQQEQRNTEF